MAKHSFTGGIHPFDGKELSKDKPIQDIWPKGEMVYPVSQHIGAPASPIVNKGDYVLRGQRIADAGGFVSSHIYSTVSGTVKAIEPRRVVTGDMVMSIIIENDEQYKEVEYDVCDAVLRHAVLKDAGLWILQPVQLHALPVWEAA